MTIKAREVKKIIAQLWKIGNKADDLCLLLQNGADLGTLIGSAASDLETMLEDGQFD